VRPAWSEPIAALIAAALASMVAVGADVVAGGEPTHTLTLGLAAMALGALRWHPQGRGRGAAGAATIALVSQPVLHASAVLVPTHAAGSGPPSVAHELTETPIGVAQLIVAMLVVVSVMSAEPLLRGFLRRRIVAVTAQAPAPWGIALPLAPALRLGRRLRGAGQRVGLRAPPAPPTAA
jgi:hypothetical protein